MGCCTNKLYIGCAENCDPFTTGLLAIQEGLHVIEVISSNYIDKYNVSYEIGEQIVIPSDFDEVGLTTIKIKQPDGSYYISEVESVEFDCFQFETKITRKCVDLITEIVGVESVSGDNVDNTDPNNPVINDYTPAEIDGLIAAVDTGVQSVSGDNVDNTDPDNPIINGYTEAEVDALISAINTIYDGDGTISEERIITNTSLESLTYISNALGNITSRTRIVSALTTAFNLHLDGANYPDTMFGSGVEVIDALGRALFIGVHNNDFKLWTEQSLYFGSLLDLIFEKPLTLDSVTSGSSSNNSIFRDSADNLLKYKDNSGTVTALIQDVGVETVNGDNVDNTDPDNPIINDYTPAEIDGFLSGKSDTGHIHDDRYYTEAEVDALFTALDGSLVGVTPFDAVTSTDVQSALEEIYGDIVIESGFENRSDSTLSFDDGTRTFTIAPAVTSFSFWCQNEKYTKSSPDTIVISADEGIHYIYYDGTGTLQETLVFTPSIITDFTFTAFIYWDSVNNKAIFFGDERHGRTMDSSTHSYLHNILSTQYDSGLAPSNIVADGNGNLDAHIQCAISNGVIRDEDIRIAITDGSPQTLDPILNVPFYYRNGINGDWRQITAANFLATTTGTGRAAWNEFTGATWQVTEAANNDFVLTHLIATNDINYPVIAIMGQGDYGNIGDARAGALTEITTLAYGPLEDAIPEYKPICTFIVQTSNTYSNSVKSRIRTNDEGDDFIDWRSSDFNPIGGTGSSDHGSLTGLGDDDHLIYAYLLGRTGGQTLIGGDAANDGLVLRSTSNATKGTVCIEGPCFRDAADNTKQVATDLTAITTATERTWTVPDRNLDFSSGGTFAENVHTHSTTDITDLASYTGLDVRYYTEAEVDALLTALDDLNGIISQLPIGNVSVNGTGNDLVINPVNLFRVVSDGGAEIQLQASELEVNTDLDLNGLLNVRDGIIFQLIAAASTATNTLFRDGTDNRLYYKNNLNELLPLHQFEEEILGTVTTDAAVTTTYTLDWESAKVYNLTLTGDTTFSDSNLPASGFTKTLEIILTGSFVPTFPATWTLAASSDAYDGSLVNRVLIDCIDSTGASEVIYYSIENL